VAHSDFRAIEDQRKATFESGRLFGQVSKRRQLSASASLEDEVRVGESCIPFAQAGELFWRVNTRRGGRRETCSTEQSASLTEKMCNDAVKPAPLTILSSIYLYSLHSLVFSKNLMVISNRHARTVLDFTTNFSVERVHLR
jgi:hypothetical protein